MIDKIVIRNYRRFRDFQLSFSSGMNILVGNNDTGKSTLIEAIHLALTCRLQGRSLIQELSPYLINQAATLEYINGLRNGKASPPPEMIIELYLNSTDETAILCGTNNLLNEKACGIRLQARLSPDFYQEYERFVSTPDTVRLVPTEYYRVEWLGFSGNGITTRSIPAAAAVIDSTNIRLQSGVDYHLQQIIHTHLAPNERVELSRQYRCLREEFADKESVRTINDRLKGDGKKVSDRSLSLSIDISQRYTWESSLTAHLDNLPFHFIGKGEQNMVKTLLAISRKDQAHVILIEEPETHLSFSSLSKLIAQIESACANQQVIIATHSAYVLNKLGLDKLILLGDEGIAKIEDLPNGTAEYFKKLAGYDTLRLVLAKKAILVEGPSDELVVQRAYKDAKGHLPIDDGIDVISVGLSHKRFLDIACRLGKRAWVVTDNDGKSAEEVTDRFSDYKAFDTISIHTGPDPLIKTLEPHIVEGNELETLNTVLKSKHTSKAEVLDRMLADKTSAALAIFESRTAINMPGYICDVVRA